MVMRLAAHRCAKPRWFDDQHIGVERIEDALCGVADERAAQP